MKKAVSLAAFAIVAATSAPVAARATSWTFGHLAALDLVPLPALASVGEVADVFVSREIGGGTVKGAPYSAETISETTQTLADGNRIVRRSTGKIARDSDGRTRQERSDGSVYINDPVAGKRWLLTANRQAIELPAASLARPPRAIVPPVPPAPPVAPQSMSADEARDWAEEMKRWAREFREKMRAEGRSGDVVVTENRRVIPAEAPSAPGGAGTPKTEVREVSVEVVDVGGAGAIAPMPPMPPMRGRQFGIIDAIPLVAPLPGGTDGGVQTALGSRTFDGVRADGTRTTWTIPAGRIGNQKPIEIVSERWYSPELLVVVETRHADPRTGETTYRLANLKRDEPSADLFKVPDGYTVRAARSRNK